jgi:hypothetical protein
MQSRQEEGRSSEPEEIQAWTHIRKRLRLPMLLEDPVRRHFNGNIEDFRATILREQRDQIREAFCGLDPETIERIADEDARQFEAALPAFRQVPASPAAHEPALKIRSTGLSQVDTRTLRETIVKLAADAEANYDNPQRHEK